MTEDEAKTKRCCGGAGCGHFNEEPYPALWCIGSACMAWRSTRTMFKDASTGKLSDRDLTGHGSWASTDGFCGLAGSPQ